MDALSTQRAKPKGLALALNKRIEEIMTKRFFPLTCPGHLVN